MVVWAINVIATHCQQADDLDHEFKQIVHTGWFMLRAALYSKIAWTSSDTSIDISLSASHMNDIIKLALINIHVLNLQHLDIQSRQVSLLVK